ACGFGAQHDDVYELGKVAVATSHRKMGLARQMTDCAAKRGKSLGASALQLYVRVELVENHAVYRALGFAHHADFTHPGYDRPTAYILRRQI
ncbi:GNAT family N-acetyltransferase, partial [Octadecabacter sp.]|nr:GNAT family N-acetyltransferase [Octadecabacter sp.]